jgi:hypothetical protein
MTTTDLTNTCHGCGEDFQPHPREGIVAYLRRRYCTRECSRKHSRPANPQPREMRRPELSNPACAGRGDVMYTDQPVGPDVDAAKAICEGCPDRVPCLTFALDNREPYGIWGGLTTRERENYLRRVSRLRNKAA